VWKNPKIVFDYLGTDFFVEMINDHFEEKPLLDPSSPELQSSEVKLVWEPVSKIYEILRRARRDQLEDTSNRNHVQELARIFKIGVLSTVRSIESHRSWGIVPALWKLPNFVNWELLQVQGQDPLNYYRSEEELAKEVGYRVEFVLEYARAVHYLLGNEERILIGTRHNQPLWAKLPRVNPSRPELPHISGHLGQVLDYLDHSDLDILPEIENLSSLDTILIGDGLKLPTIEAGAYDSIADLLEDAFYNQQYLPHPTGSLIKIAGCHGVESVIVKAKRGLLDPNYLDFLGLFTIHGHKVLKAFSGGLVMQRFGDKISLFENAGAADEEAFLNWLLAQVYHDLVTAKDVEPGKKRKARTTKSLPQPPAGAEELRWIYIPRQRKKETLEIRRPSPTPRSMTPHRVRGHKRRANMSDAQRLAIQTLEAEIGIDILKWVPEGYTFVRPHVAPKEGSECLEKLPRFIRTRIQDDIKQLLASPAEDE